MTGTTPADPTKMTPRAPICSIELYTSREWKAGSAGNKSGFLNVAQPGPHGRPKMTSRAPTAGRKSETNLCGTIEILNKSDEKT